MSSKQSTSDQWRVKGNEKYSGGCATGINPHLQKDRMFDALTFYHKALNTAVDDHEKASASKNLGLANWKMAYLQRMTGMHAMHSQSSYKEGLSYLTKAFCCGQRCKDGEWLAKINQQILSLMNDAFKFHESSSYKDRIANYEQYTEILLDMPFKAECYKNIGELIFKKGITALQKGDYKQALYDMKECYRPIEEARRLAGEDEALMSDIRVLETDCFVHTCTAESVQARTIGDEILQEVLEQEETLLMTRVFDALDWYKKALILTREADVEMEAIANSRIGVIYDKIIKREDKAHTYFKRCIDLTLTLSPRNFGTEEWFKKATEALQRYQEEKTKQEDAEWNKAREKYVKELSKELETLKKEDDKGIPALLLHIYKEYPPKKTEHKLDKTEKELKGLTRKELQQILKKSLIHYHPDKQKEHGEKWVVICEEVTKILTRQYECYKGVD